LLTKRSLVLVLVAVAFLSCSQPTPTRTNAHLLQDADRAMLQGNWERGAALYEQFLADNPGDDKRAEIRMQAGKCRLGGGNVESATRSFDQALLDQPPGHIRWEILFRRAVAYRLLGDSA